MQNLVLKDGRNAWLHGCNRSSRSYPLWTRRSTPTRSRTSCNPYGERSISRATSVGDRVVKQTTILQITWAILVLVTVSVIVLTRGHAQPDAPVAWVVVLFGLLGGTVSALRTVDFSRLHERSSLENEAVRLRLRPVLGAAAALVTYVLAGWGCSLFGAPRGLFRFKFKWTLPHDHFWAYCAIGFMAGFSERWFLRLLDSTITSAQSPEPLAAQRSVRRLRLRHPHQIARRIRPPPEAVVTHMPLLRKSPKATAKTSPVTRNDETGESRQARPRSVAGARRTGRLTRARRVDVTAEP